MVVDYPENWKNLEEHLSLNLNESSVKNVIMTLSIYNSFFKRLNFQSDSKQLAKVLERIYEPLVNILKILENEHWIQSLKMKIYASKIIISNISENSIFYLSEIFYNILFWSTPILSPVEEELIKKEETSMELNLDSLSLSQNSTNVESPTTILEHKLKNKALLFFQFILDKYGNTDSLSYDKYYINEMFIGTYLRLIAEFWYEIIRKGKQLKFVNVWIYLNLNKQMAKPAYKYFSLT